MSTAWAVTLGPGDRFLFFSPKSVDSQACPRLVSRWAAEGQLVGQVITLAWSSQWTRGGTGLAGEGRRKSGQKRPDEPLCPTEELRPSPAVDGKAEG